MFLGRSKGSTCRVRIRFESGQPGSYGPPVGSPTKPIDSAQSYASSPSLVERRRLRLAWGVSGDHRSTGTPETQGKSRQGPPCEFHHHSEVQLLPQGLGTRCRVESAQKAPPSSLGLHGAHSFLCRRQITVASRPCSLPPPLKKPAPLSGHLRTTGSIP